MTNRAIDIDWQASEALPLYAGEYLIRYKPKYANFYRYKVERFSGQWEGNVGEGEDFEWCEVPE